MKDYTARAAGASRPTLLAMLDKNRQVVETAISRRDGQVVKTMGDAFLITFESATNAVLAGIAIQQAAARHNTTAVEADQLELRVAICTGEVTYTNDDIFGTPVNIAARLQTMASPGEVLFTESTFHAMNVPEVGHEDVGDKSLKGIPGMVRVFRAKV
jgi:adenylate cyclase